MVTRAVAFTTGRGRGMGASHKSKRGKERKKGRGGKERERKKGGCTEKLTLPYGTLD